MGIQQILFSKLIKACEVDWIPEADCIYGEPAFATPLPKGLKKLIYEPKKQRGLSDVYKQKVIRNKLQSTKPGK